jgi:TNF receptor-associated protein 1
LSKFQNKEIVSVEKSDIDLGDNGEEKSDGSVDSDGLPMRLSKEEAERFCAWFQLTLADKVLACKVTTRLKSSPAVITNNQSGAMRRMMRLVETQDGKDASALPKQQVEINPSHPMIACLNSIREKEPILAKVCAEQIYDNCLIAAGLLDDGRSMLGRLNDILLSVVKGAAKDVKTENEEKSSQDP